MAKSEWYEGKEGKAEHLVYLSDKARELEKLLNKEKTMIIRGAAGKKSPLGGRAKVGDDIYLVETGGDMTVTHKGVISDVVESEKMTPAESSEFIKKYEKEYLSADSVCLLSVRVCVLFSAIAVPDSKFPRPQWQGERF